MALNLLACAAVCLRWVSWLLVALVIYGCHPLQRWKYRKLPGPPPTWLIGNLATIIRLGYPKALQQWGAEFGPVFKVWQGGNVLVVVGDAEAARVANLHNHSRPPIFFNFVGDELKFDKAGMLLAKGDKYWQSLKHAWQAMFHSSSLRGYTGLMNASMEQLVDVLAAKAETGEEVEIWRLFGCLTLEVVGSTAFGIQLDTMKEHARMAALEPSSITFDASDSDTIVLLKSLALQFAFKGPGDSLYALCNLLFPDACFLFRFLGTYLPDAALRKQIEARRQMRSVCYKIISRARQRSSGSGSCSGGDSAARRSDDGWEVVPPRRGALPAGGFISHLLSSDNKLIGRRFTDLEVAAQAFTATMGGYETSASLLAFAVHFIAQHPDKEAKLLAEVDVFGRHAVPTFDDCDQFPYLDAVLNETLRLLPPISLGTIREARTEMQLHGFTIPQGSYINAAIFSFQNSEKYWKDASKFEPERFLAEPFMPERAYNNPAFCAFGDGGRACPGVKLAKAVARIALIRLYQRFTLQLTPGQLPLAVHTNLTMAPTHGVKVLVKRRP